MPYSFTTQPSMSGPKPRTEEASPLEPSLGPPTTPAPSQEATLEELLRDALSKLYAGELSESALHLINQLHRCATEDPPGILRLFHVRISTEEGRHLLDERIYAGRTQQEAIDQAMREVWHPRLSLAGYLPHVRVTPVLEAGGPFSLYADDTLILELDTLAMADATLHPLLVRSQVQVRIEDAEGTVLFTLEK